MPPLIAPIALACGLAILAAETGWRRLFYVAKPTATLLILGQVALFQSVAPPPARLPLLAALTLSLVGDVLLMLPADRFREGLLAFLLAHLAYLTAFAARLTQPPPALVLAALVAVVVLALRWMGPGMGSMRLPTGAYGLAMSLVAWAAWGAWSEERRIAGALGVAGGLLFMASDILLAVRQFRGAFPANHALTLALYYAGQILLSQSFVV
jgi:uncharacterized membrane protein YhhN